MPRGEGRGAGLWSIFSDFARNESVGLQIAMSIYRGKISGVVGFTILGYGSSLTKQGFLTKWHGLPCPLGKAILTFQFPKYILIECIHVCIYVCMC